MRRRTWKVLEWKNPPEGKRWIPLDCSCGYEAEIESGALSGGFIIASIGMSYIFDPAGFTPPANFLPNKIKCRRCRRIYN